jgi:hypothetical protein
MKWSIISFAVLVLASCQHRQEQFDPTLENFFTEESGDARSPARFAQAQAASGARADATLSRHHFDGPRLNSLGQEKLSLMLKDDDAAEPMRVFLNLDEREASSGARRDAVVAFAKDAGLTDSQIEIVYGHNPEAWSRSSTHLSNLPKTQTGTPGQSAALGNTDAESSTSGKSTGGGNGLAGGEVNLFK